MHSISFQTFFVQAIKVVVGSWKIQYVIAKYVMRWRTNFMISGSNEQLQQQLEYTLLKPYCHGRCISKMQSDTLEERYGIKLRFKLGKMPQKRMECFRLLFDHLAWVFEWHKRFKEGRESVRDDERCGRSMEVNTPELIGQRLGVRVTMLRFIREFRTRFRWKKPALSKSGQWHFHQDNAPVHKLHPIWHHLSYQDSSSASL